jgi:hypothetical protein
MDLEPVAAEPAPAAPFELGRFRDPRHPEDPRVERVGTVLRAGRHRELDVMDRPDEASLH